jgi:hypothetical protein
LLVTQEEEQDNVTVTAAFREGKDMSKEYNGYPSWNTWNVSLWLNNDETIYKFCKEALKLKGRRKTIDFLVEMFQDCKTPDGARYNRRSITIALEDME